MSNQKTTKQIRVVSKYAGYDVGRVICIDNESADEWVAKGDAEYIHEKDKPVPKRRPGRPKKIIEVAAVEPAQTPEGGILKNFRKKRGE